MQRYYSDREVYGPEFDDRLIQLVRDNPAIYDVSHPNYRRNPVRVAIWERIANELGATSRFLQTKWKNIRYNYLQEIKCLETGHSNANIRKRRFTEDLSFLQNTAQTYNVKKSSIKNSYNGSDNDSNSHMYTDVKTPNAYEVIEIEHSDDGGAEADADAEVDAGSQQNFEVTHLGQNFDDTPLLHCEVERKETPFAATLSLDGIIESTTADESEHAQQSPRIKTHTSSPSSPLLTPLIVMGNGKQAEANGEVTIEPIPKHTQRANRHSAPAVQPLEIIANATKRKSMPAPFPVLTPINDPIELYCLSLVDSLRSMPRSERERVKFEFAKILKDAKYKDES